MISDDRTQKESDQQGGKSDRRKHHGDAAAVYDSPQRHHDQGKQEGWYQIILIQPDQLGILDKVAHGFEVGILIITPYDPAHMRIPESIQFHRVRILRRITMTMVVAVIARPP